MRESALARRVEADAPALQSVSPVRPRRPEERLMLAILEDAVRIFKDYAALPDPHVRRLHADIERWFDSGPTGWPFDFENICDALGFDASAIRSRLLRGRTVPIARLDALASFESRRS